MNEREDLRGQFLVTKKRNKEGHRKIKGEES